MAKLRVHGKALGTVHFTTYAKRYMSDGVILKNIGFGWKIYGKVKAGATPQQAFDSAKAKQVAFAEQRPCAEAYRRELHNMAGLSKRWKLHAAVQMMPDDPDGVWSEACDGYGYENCSASVDEIGVLCRLYKVALAEHERLGKIAA